MLEHNMTANQVFVGAPFGSKVTRFPDKLHTPTSENLGPGCYDADNGDFSAKTVKKRASGPGWERAFETSHMIALPYLLNKEEWEKHQEVPRKLGPGTYNLKDSIETSYEKGYSRGILATREPRFKEDKSMVTPGPGTYGQGGIPQASTGRISFGSVGMLDYGGNGSRSLPTEGSRLCPGTYTIPSAVDELLNKKTGTRGPYEVFTLDRSKPIKTGHYSTQDTYNLGPGQYNLKSSLDENSKSRSGKLGKGAQYPRHPVDRNIVSTLALNPRDPSDPGPGQYDPKDPHSRPLSQAVRSPPFSSSCQRADKLATKFFTGNYNPVGPGRYDVQKRMAMQDVNGCQSAFKSKTDRPSGIRLQMLSERLAVKNLPFPRDHLLLVPSHEPKCYSAA